MFKLTQQACKILRDAIRVQCLRGSVACLAWLLSQCGLMLRCLPANTRPLIEAGCSCRSPTLPAQHQVLHAVVGGAEQYSRVRAVRARATGASASTSCGFPASGDGVLVLDCCLGTRCRSSGCEQPVPRHSLRKGDPGSAATAAAAAQQTPSPFGLRSRHRTC